MTKTTLTASGPLRTWWIDVYVGVKPLVVCYTQWTLRAGSFLPVYVKPGAMFGRADVISHAELPDEKFSELVESLAFLTGQRTGVAADWTAGEVHSDDKSARVFVNLPELPPASEDEWFRLIARISGVVTSYGMGQGAGWELLMTCVQLERKVRWLYCAFVCIPHPPDDGALIKFAASLGAALKAPSVDLEHRGQFQQYLIG